MFPRDVTRCNPSRAASPARSSSEFLLAPRRPVVVVWLSSHSRETRPPQNKTWIGTTGSGGAYLELRLLVLPLDRARAHDEHVHEPAHLDRRDQPAPAARSERGRRCGETRDASAGRCGGRIPALRNRPRPRTRRGTNASRGRTEPEAESARPTRTEPRGRAEPARARLPVDRALVRGRDGGVAQVELTVPARGAVPRREFVAVGKDAPQRQLEQWLQRAETKDEWRRHNAATSGGNGEERAGERARASERAPRRR